LHFLSITDIDYVGMRINYFLETSAQEPEHMQQIQQPTRR